MANNKKSNYRSAVPADIKLSLYLEAGNKCANPGCPNAMVEYHHIREWHVYKTHDQQHMIAVCPTCHSHAHYGHLKIDEKTIRYWKSVPRSIPNRSHIHVDDAEQCRILLGSIYGTNGKTTPKGLTVFNLSQSNRLSFRIADDTILMTNLTLTDTSGREVVRVVNGHLKHSAKPPVQYESRTGKWRITAPATAEYLPDWVIASYNQNPPGAIDDNGRFTMLEVEVLAPGLIQVQGVWVEDERAVIITTNCLSIYRPNHGFIHLRGYGEFRDEPKNLSNLPTFVYEGPIEYFLFQYM